MRISHIYIMVLIKSTHFFLHPFLLSVPQNYPKSNFMCFFTFNLLSSFWTDNLLVVTDPSTRAWGASGDKNLKKTIILSKKLSLAKNVSSQCGIWSVQPQFAWFDLARVLCVLSQYCVNSYVHLPSCFQKTLSLCSILPWVFIFLSHLFEPWEEGYNTDFPLRAEHFTLSYPMHAA